MHQIKSQLTKINTLRILPIPTQITLIIHNLNLMIKYSGSISLHDGIFENGCVKVNLVVGGGGGEEALLIVGGEGEHECCGAGDGDG